VNPLIVDKLANAIKPGLGDSMNSGVKNFKESSLNRTADEYVNSNDPIEKIGLAIALGVGSVAIPESVTDLELSVALGGFSKAYAYQIAAGLNKVDNAASGLWNRLFGGSVDNALSTGISANRKVVIGENMGERVIPYAEEIGAKYYKPRSTNPDNWMRNNQRWITKEIKLGTEFHDVGIDSTRALRSEFYQMEKQVLEKYNIKPTTVNKQ